MPKPEPSPLQSVLSDNLRRLRSESGLNQDELATRARQRGLAWNRSTVADIEAGRRDVPLEEFILLPNLFEGSGSLEEWLTHEGEIQVGEKTFAPAEIVGIMANTTRVLFSTDTLSIPVEDSAQREAEKGAARALESTPLKVADVSYRLWGRGLTEERDARLAATSSERDLVRRKGHITRALIGELREALKPRRKR